MSKVTKRWQEDWVNVHQDYRDLYELAGSIKEYRVMAEKRKNSMHMASLKDVAYRVHRHTETPGLLVVRKWNNATTYEILPDTAEYKWVSDKIAILRLLKDGEEMQGVGNKIDSNTFWVYSKFEE